MFGKVQRSGKVNHGLDLADIRTPQVTPSSPTTSTFRMRTQTRRGRSSSAGLSDRCGRRRGQGERLLIGDR